VDPAGPAAASADAAGGLVTMPAMTTAQAVQLTVAAVLVVSAAVPLWLGRRRPAISQRHLAHAERYLARRRLPADPELVALTMRFDAARRRSFWYGLAVVLVVVGVVVAVAPRLLLGQWLGPAAIPVIWVLAAGGIATKSDRMMRRQAPKADGPHVAHGARPQVVDYVPWISWWWQPVSIVIGAVAVGTYVVDVPGGKHAPPGAVVAAWAAASAAVVAVMVLARWLVRRPQSAATPGTLALRNEITGDTLGALLSFPIMGWTLGTVHSSSEVLLLAAMVLMLPPLAAETQRRRQVRERLWTPRRPVAGSG